MPYLIIIIFIVVMIVNAKKQKEEAERRRQRAAQQTFPGQNQAPGPKPPYPPQASQTARPVQQGMPPRQAPAGDPRFPEYRQPDRRYAVPVPPAPAVRGASEGGADGEATASESRQNTLMEPRISTLHLVRPATESVHSHEESSMAGILECPPERAGSADEGTSPAPRHRIFPAFHWSGDQLAAGIIYAEILGKPKALRR